MGLAVLPPPGSASSGSRNQEGLPAKTAVSGPSSALTKILDPRNSTPEIRRTAEDLLTGHHLSTNASCSLIPPLAEPVSATINLFHLREETQAEPEPDWADPSPDGYFKRSLACHLKLQFMGNDTPLPVAKRPMLQLNEVLRFEDQTETRSVTYDLKMLVDVTLRERPRIEERRAADRAHAAVLLLGAQLKKLATKRQQSPSVMVDENQRLPHQSH